MNDRVTSVSNKIISEIAAKLFECDDIMKFLYYTDKKYENQSIFDELKVSPAKIINKCIFINRRIPTPLTNTGAFMAIRFYDYGGKSVGKNIKKMLIDIDIIVHEDCMTTMHGTRDTFLIDAVQNALDCSLPSSVGKCKVKRTYDILGLNTKYSGFTVRMEVDAFNKK